MKINRSVPPATVVPVLVYPDVRAAVEFLSGAFGFVERTGSARVIGRSWPSATTVR